MRGGARVNSGPAPDPNALRRERPSDKDGWRILPRSRSEAAPEWPLLPDVAMRAELEVTQAQVAELQAQVSEATPRRRGALAKKLGQAQMRARVMELSLAQQTETELALWTQLWTTPQSNAWAELGLGTAREVARYVRHAVKAEAGSAEDAREARQWSDRIGLNPTAMLRNRWKVAPDEMAERRGTKPAAAAVARASSRDRLKAMGATGGAS
jgi:hypothetical protein